jgi:hypothetical protein
MDVLRFSTKMAGGKSCFTINISIPKPYLSAT